MYIVDDWLLGSQALHHRFFATTEILAKLVASAPRFVSLHQLENETGRKASRLIKLCASLEHASLLLRDPGGEQKWVLACSPGAVTLEDALRCVLMDQGRARRGNESQATSVRADLEIFLMQAMLAVNQCMFMQLRQFSLDRLKVSAAGAFPSVKRPLHNAHLDDNLDTAIQGRETNFV
jgi:DNA-binding IscR family transcriptional regulator